nr:MAG TPA: tail assembly chaperone protein [Caudoviricetes sp.]
MKPVNFSLSGEDYQLLPHTGFEAVNLYRKVNGAVGHIVAAFDSKANPGSAGFSAIASAFSEIGEDEFRWLAGTTLSHVTVVTPGKKNLSLRDMDAVAEHFDGRWAGMYELMFQVWSLEKMLPFEMSPETGTDGNGTGRTDT